MTDINVLNKIIIMSQKILFIAVLLVMNFPGFGQNNIPTAKTTTASEAASDQAKKVDEWVASLNLNDAAKAERVAKVIIIHLDAVRDWHNEHPFTLVPEGINPANGRPLNELDRQFIADSSLPKTVHEQLMAGLRKDLTEEQVEIILDKYTVGKVAFTIQGYKAIVPDLKPEEEVYLLARLKEAREMAVDYKSMKLISMVFEIYKTKCEQFLNENGRSWKALYKAYTDQIKAKKAEAAKNPK
jgi:Protein of unknown function (DUF3826)